MPAKEFVARPVRTTAEEYRARMNIARRVQRFGPDDPELPALRRRHLEAKAVAAVQRIAEWDLSEECRAELAGIIVLAHNDGEVT